MYYILHGDEEFERAEKVAEYKQKILADGMGDLNITTLDGRDLTLADLISACGVVPFLTDRRLVIVENLLQREEQPEEQGQASSAPRPSILPALLEYLPHLPASTRLCLVVNRSLSAEHPLRKLAASDKDAHVLEFRRPRDDELPAWIQRRAERIKLRLEPGTAALLAQQVGRDLRALDGELDKLGAYVDYARAVSVDDVRAVVSRTLDNDIFGLVDALGMRQGKRAMHLLEDMLEAGEHPLRLLSMVARQVRLIMMAEGLTEERKLSEADLRREMGVRDFVAAKLVAQARQFSHAGLVRAHRLVLATEQACKTGAVEPWLGLELLVVELCARRTT